jgi:hypothetical protein
LFLWRITSSAADAQFRADASQQFRRSKGLVTIIRAGSTRLHVGMSMRAAVRTITGYARLPGPYGFMQHFKPVHFRHVDIQENSVGISERVFPAFHPIRYSDKV